MSASLSKKVRDLETAFWSQAKWFELPVADEGRKFLKSLSPLGVFIFNTWYASDSEAQKLAGRMDQIDKTLPPIHPAFLADLIDANRRTQWGFYHSAEYREALEGVWTRFLEHARPRYDVKDGGLIGVAMRFFEKDIDVWVEQRNYFGMPVSREELADDRIRLWKVIRRLNEEKGEPENQKTSNERWRHAVREYIRACYGREITDDDFELDGKMWAQLREDMEAGKPAEESEAARYFRDLYERYPRKVPIGTYQSRY